MSPLSRFLFALLLVETASWLSISPAPPPTFWARVLLGPRPLKGVRSWGMREIWHAKLNGTNAPTRTSALVPAEKHWLAAPVPNDVTTAGGGMHIRGNHLLDIRGPAVVLLHGVVLTAQPLAVVDVSGGCCRKPPFAPRTPVPFDELLKMQGLRSWQPIVRRLAQNDSSVEWLFLCLSARSTTYFHAIAETSARLMYALGPLTDPHSNVKVLVTSASMPGLLAMLGVG